MKRKAFSKRYDGVAHRAALRLLSLALLAVCTSSDVHAYSPSVGSAGVGRAGVRELGGATLITENTYNAAGQLLSTTQSAIGGSVPSGAPSEAWQNLQIERYLPYELTIA